jgi:hypothetical protein
MGCRQLCEWVAIPSLSGQDTAAEEYVAAQMKPCGLAVDVGELDLERLPRHPAFSAEVEREHGLGVVAASND